MPQQRFRRFRWGQTREPTPPPPDPSPRVPAGIIGLFAWMHDWLRSGRFLGPICFGMGSLGYCTGLWLPIENAFVELLPFRNMEGSNEETVRHIVGPVILVLLTSLYTWCFQKPGYFNTAHFNGFNAALGSFIGMHVMEAVGHLDTREVAVVLFMAPYAISLLSNFIEFEGAWFSPITITALIYGVCVPTWAMILSKGELNYTMMTTLDLSLYAMSASMTEYYLRKACLLYWKKPTNMLPLLTQLITDIVFTWIACSDLVEVIAGHNRQMKAKTSTQRAALGARCETPCQVIHFSNLAAMLVLIVHSINWIIIRSREGKWLFVLVGICCLVPQVVYVSIIGSYELSSSHFITEFLR